MAESNIEEEFVTRLINPDEWQYHLNQVESVTTRRLSLLKRKFVSKAGYEVIDYPMSDCVGVEYHDERPVVVAIAGVLLMLLIFSIFCLVASQWNSLDPELSIPVGLLCLAAIYGARWAFGSRRHRIVFELKSGKKLIWRSRFGDFKYKQGASNHVVAFARRAQILKSRSPAEGSRS